MSIDQPPPEISRTNPTCFLFLVDQSGSMIRNFGSDSKKKMAEGVADAVNRLLQSLLLRNSRGDEVLDRFFVGLLGYSSQVGSAFGGDLAGRYLVPISEIAAHPLRVDTRTRTIDDGAGGLFQQKIKFPIWLDPKAQGQTHMREALNLARDLISDFIGNYPDCYPPIVINITDGEPSDAPPGEVEAAAQLLRSVASTHGNVLLFNIHISPEDAPKLEYPSQENQLQNPYARLLFRMSSPLPPAMVSQAIGAEVHIADGARGFVFNGDLVSVIKFLDIGTRVDRNAN